MVEANPHNTVLVVHDAPDQLELMSLLLKKSGHRVVTARDGREGFEAARRERPALVISDVSMPHLDGIEMCRLIRCHPSLRMTPVLLVSAMRTGSASVVEGLKGGADDYLEAPYEPVLLIAKVTRLLERRRAEESLRQSESRLAEAQRLARLGNWDWELKSGRLTWSDEIYRIYGFEPRAFEPTYETFLKCVHPEDLDRVVGIIEEAVRDRRPLNYHLRIVRADGVRILHSRGDFIRDERGEVVRMYGTAQDVTERVLAEERLRGSNEKLRALSARLQSVREEESRRISREIHDELGGALTGLKMDVAWVERRLAASETEAARQKLGSMSELIDETIQKVRNISTELRPSILDDLGLAAAIEWQAREFQRRTEVECRITRLEEEVTMSPEKSTAVFRIFQEVLTNVARHAAATLVEVSLEQSGGDVVLKVRDNGRGVRESDITAGGSLGLLGMRERAGVFGGVVRVEGEEGKGTSVTVSIPRE
jgi:PAS domain S-box-containing protein